MEAIFARLTRRTPLASRRRASVLAVPAVLVVLATTAAPPFARATTVVAKRFADLCAEADLVFAGNVTAVESGWRDGSKQAIETRVSFGSITWLRGGPRPTLTLRFAGGSADGLTEEVAGMPRFAVGDRVVLFARDGDFVSPIVGFHQGVFRVVEGANGPTVIDAEGQPVATIGGAAIQRGTPSNGAVSALSLDEFLARVRAELARPR